MIYKNPANALNETTVLFEATGFETVKFIEKDDIPKAFKDTALKVLDCLEKEGKNAKGGTNDTVADAFKIFTRDARASVEDEDPVRAYYFLFPHKVKFGLGFRIPEEYKQFGHKVLTAAGFKKGQTVANDKLGSYYYIKSKTKSGKPCYFISWIAIGERVIVANTKIAIPVQCVVCDEDSKAFIESATSVSSDALNHTKEELTPNTVGFQGMTPEELYGFTPELGLTRSESLSDSDYGDFFRDPKIMSTFTEHLDLSDSLTRKAVIAMNEADQGAILTALTSKLYDNIVSKVDDIDYGEIPMSKGDVTKLSNYEKIRECIELLKNILKEFKQDDAPVEEISKALSNVSANKDIFTRGFKFNCELPIIMYNNTVLAIITGVSYMIATCIEFMKTPNQDTFQITLDKVAYAKTKNNMLYNNLKRFNKSCDSGDFQKAMEHVLQNRIKGLGEAAAIGTFIATWAGKAVAAAGIAGIIAIITHIIPILREMVFFFYYTRMRVSDFFDIQADLLQMNAYNVENDPNKDEKQKERIVSKQLKIVELFRKIANKISFTGRKAEVEATKEITNTSKKMKLNDISDELPDSVSALF